MSSRVANAHKRTSRLYQRPPTINEIQRWGNPQGTPVSIKDLLAFANLATSGGYIIEKTGDINTNPAMRTYHLPGDPEATEYNQHESSTADVRFLCQKAYRKSKECTRLAVGTADRRDHPKKTKKIPRKKGDCSIPIKEA